MKAESESGDGDENMNWDGTMDSIEYACRFPRSARDWTLPFYNICPSKSGVDKIIQYAPAWQYCK